MQIIYDIENFSFQYPGQSTPITIKGCLKIHKGDIVLLQGNSGSGKSTLMMALGGLIPNLINGRLSGTVLFKHNDITTLEHQQLNSIGYLGQNPDSQLICETVYKELAFGLENMQLSPEIIAQKIFTLSKQFDITHLLTRQVNNLSGGEKQKINLLALILMDPEVLLLDEPTAFLDPNSANEIISILKTFSQNKTIIIIEHNTKYLNNFINRLIVIDENNQIVEKELNALNLRPDYPLLSCKLRNDDKYSSTNDILRIANLNFAYTDQPYLLKNINLRINQGSIIGIVGRNGSGKSSLLKAIGKIIPCNNSIFYNEKNISKITHKKYWEKVTLLWQNPENHFLYQSVNEELRYNHNIIEKFALKDTSMQNPFCLSEGQKRRLSLAITFNQNVDLFLLDEPTFGQDQINKQKLATIINDLSQVQKSFIIVSHDIEFLSNLTNEIYELKNGNLVSKNEQ